MENSIEAIWKQGFLNESSLVAPKVNDLYNKKSIHVVDKIKRKIKSQRTFAVILALFLPFIYYFVGAFWQGLALCTMILFMLWYSKGIINSVTTLDQGVTSYAYLKSFDSWLKDIFVIDKNIARYSMPLYCLIGLSGIWSFWNSHGIFLILQHRYPTINIPLVGLAYLGTILLLVILFSGKMHKWGLRMLFGPLIDKLEETIAEMEKLKQEE